MSKNAKAFVNRMTNEDKYEYRARNMINNIRTRAARKEIEFDLTMWWLEQKLRKGVCEVTGLPLRIAEKKAGGRTGIHHWDTASVDRVDNDKGYTKDNCKVVCWMYNAAKGTDTHDDVLKMCRALLSLEANKQEPEEHEAISVMISELREEMLGE